MFRRSLYVSGLVFFCANHFLVYTNIPYISVIFLRCKTGYISFCQHTKNIYLQNGKPLDTVTMIFQIIHKIPQHNLTTVLFHQQFNVKMPKTFRQLIFSFISMYWLLTILLTIFVSPDSSQQFGVAFVLTSRLYRNQFLQFYQGYPPYQRVPIRVIDDLCR